MDIAITNIDYLLTGTEVLRNTDVVIRDGMIASVKPSTNDSRYRDATIIDGTDKAVMPSFKNAHTHAAMTLLRGYGDDMPLDPWLRTRIWPAEAVLLPEDIYWGTRLAALEMIRTGTTFANDMYFVPDEAIRAFRDAKIRAAVGLAIFDFNDHERCRREKKRSRNCWPAIRKWYRPRVRNAFSSPSLPTVRTPVARIFSPGARLCPRVPVSPTTFTCRKLAAK